MKERRESVRILLAIACCLTIPAAAAPYLYQGFENIDAMSGWEIINNSTPGGQTPEGWFQGSGIFVAPAGSPNSYAQANFENAGDPGDISTWLLSPVITLERGRILSFLTIGEDVAGFPDRLEIRLSTAGASSDVGSTPQSVGNFSELLLSINPALEDSGYPTQWTEYRYAFSQLTGPTDARIGFRYFVTDRSMNASTIGIDSIAVVPEPNAGILAGLALAVLAVRRRFAVRRES
jgi:hypothetical protein